MDIMPPYVLDGRSLRSLRISGLLSYDNFRGLDKYYRITIGEESFMVDYLT